MDWAKRNWKETNKDCWKRDGTLTLTNRFIVIVSSHLSALWFVAIMMNAKFNGSMLNVLKKNWITIRNGTAKNAGKVETKERVVNLTIVQIRIQVEEVVKKDEQWNRFDISCDWAINFCLFLSFHIIFFFNLIYLQTIRISYLRIF